MDTTYKQISMYIHTVQATSEWIGDTDVMFFCPAWKGFTSYVLQPVFNLQMLKV
jgi:hypothetical protein